MKCDPSSWLEEHVWNEESFQHGDEIIESREWQTWLKSWHQTRWRSHEGRSAVKA